MYVGIDLGTTNSAICTYDGNEVRIWKSPEQNDVTPSAIFVNNRGNRYYGAKAYNQAPQSPDSAATLFKMLMGTNTPIKIPAANLLLTPEECSAEILRLLFGYLPEEIRNSDSVSTVITVPAAFNQMQKDATLQAANLADIGRVALMQEPVAAVMSVMRAKKKDGIFVIFDLGGGTLDISIAESIGGNVNLLAHGGKTMHGGRNFDMLIYNNIVKPWIFENFNLPDDFSVKANYKSLNRLGVWATERAKIELSSREDVVISLSESETRTKDLDGNDIYLDVSLTRKMVDQLIEEMIIESIDTTRITLEKTGLTSNDVERIVFVGGPTNYKPLRDKVSFEIGIPSSLDVNPMTAVAEGASIFAESIDWSSEKHNRKSTRGELTSDIDLGLSFKYVERTPEDTTKVMVELLNPINGYTFDLKSLDTGWISGSMELINGMIFDLPLSKNNINKFEISALDKGGNKVTLFKSIIEITKTASSVGSIPASHTISIEVLEKMGGMPKLFSIIKEGESLPKKTTIKFKAAQALKAGSSTSLNFKFWEGDIQDPITDNRPIGCFKIAGTDFETGIIPVASELLCDFEISDAGVLSVGISIPEISAVFDKNFYTRQGESGGIDFSSDFDRIIEEASTVMERTEEIAERVNDPLIDKVRDKLETVLERQYDESETEEAQKSYENIVEAKKILAEIKKNNLNLVRQGDLDGLVEFFNNIVKEFATIHDMNSFEKMVKTAQKSIDNDLIEFENQLDEIRFKNFEVLFKQDWFVVSRFNSLIETPYQFNDSTEFVRLKKEGQKCLAIDDIDCLRMIVHQLDFIKILSNDNEDMYDAANILRG